MRLESVLFKGDITVKTLRTQGDELILETDPSDSVPGTLYVTPGDIAGMVKLILSPASLGYMFRLPFRYRAWKKRQAQAASGTGAESNSQNWW